MPTNWASFDRRRHGERRRGGLRQRDRRDGADQLVGRRPRRRRNALRHPREADHDRPRRDRGPQHHGRGGQRDDLPRSESLCGAQVVRALGVQRGRRGGLLDQRRVREGVHERRRRLPGRRSAPDRAAADPARLPGAEVQGDAPEAPCADEPVHGRPLPTRASRTPTRRRLPTATSTSRTFRPAGSSGWRRSRRSVSSRSRTERELEAIGRGGRRKPALSRQESRQTTCERLKDARLPLEPTAVTVTLSQPLTPRKVAWKVPSARARVSTRFARASSR